MDRKMISEALGGIDEKYVIEALVFSGRAALPGKENNMNRKSISKGSRILLIAAVLAMVLGITAGAYVAFTHYESPGEMMENFAGGEANTRGEGYERYETVNIEGEERIQLSELRLGWERLSTDEALLEELVYPYVAALDGSFTWGDYTITMEACIYDKDTLGGILYYTVENPNGVDWSYKEGGGVVLDGDAYLGLELAAKSFVDSERSTDTKLYVCEHFIIVPEWFELDYLDPGLSVSRGVDREGISFESYIAELEKIELPHTELDGGNITVSPYGMAFSKTGIGSEKGVNHQYIALRFADGSEYVVYDRPNLFANEVCGLSNGDWETHLFNSIIDIGAVTEVQIDEAVFSVE